MNKKYLIKIITAIIFVVTVIFVWVFIAFWGSQKNSEQEKIIEDSPSFRDAVNWDEPFLKEIKVEFLDKEEKQKMNIADNKTMRLQVLERDENGNVTAYKKIYDDQDVVKYIYDPSGRGSSMELDSTTTPSNPTLELK